MKRYLNTIIAIAVLGALYGGFTYWDKRKSSEPAKSESSTTSEKVFSVDASHVQALTIRPRSGEAVVCRREGATWTITEPRKLAADQSAVTSLLTSLTGATIDQVVDPKPASLKDFGLETPSLTLEVTTNAKPDKVTLLLGDDTPTSGGVYAQVAGNPRVLTLPSFLKSSLDKKEFDLRDKRIVTLAAGQVNRIEVVGKTKRWTLAKNPEGVWDLVLPPAVRADRFAAEGIASRLENGTMQSVAA